MALTVQDFMTTDPVTMKPEANLREVAQQMRVCDIGDVLVTDDRGVRGIVTDRDIVVRCVAEGTEPEDVAVGSLCTRELVTVPPDAPVLDAIRLMIESAVRRIPVVEDGHLLGILSLGDLARLLDRDSALGQISAARPQS